MASLAKTARVADPVFLATPHFVATPLSDVLGARVVANVEMLNPMRCFKGRGVHTTPPR